MSKPKFDRIITVEDSTMISGMVYDVTKLILDIQFKSGGAIYRYRNVSAIEFALLVTSKSTGKTFNANIKNIKKFTKLRRTVLA